MKKLALYSLLLLMILVGACRSKTKLPRVSRAALERSNQERITAIKQADVNFTSLSVKAKADLNIGGNNNEVTFNFRMLKDQKIWISVTALAGLEVSRILITPDSIQILNRIDNVYIQKPFNFIETYTNDQISFSTIQSILLGNSLAEAYPRGYNFELAEEGLWLNAQSRNLIYRLLFNPSFKVKALNLQDEDKGQQLSVKYDDFYLEADLMLPHQIRLKSVAGTKAIEVDFKYTKIEKDLVLDFPFSVPKRFSVKN